MWKATAGSKIKVDVKKTDDDDDWEVDPDFQNDVTEKEQRWGSKTVSGSGRTDFVDLNALKESVKKSDADNKKIAYDRSSKPSFGYGGAFGVQKDRMDKCAVGNDYVAAVDKHTSQKDYSQGFGGKYGVQTDRKDKSAAGWEYQAEVQKHGSQQDYSKGFGGKYGVQKDRQDKAAVGWEHKAELEKHSSQKDYSQGFGGKFGVQKERQDKSAVGWEHREETEKHGSQQDYSKGFGGKYGVQTDRQDKSAVGWEHKEELGKHASQQDYSQGFGGKFGVQKDRQDKSAVGWEHKQEVEKHSSQTDQSKGFGGKFGVQTDRQDKSALGWDTEPEPKNISHQKEPDVPTATVTKKIEQISVQEDIRIEEQSSNDPVEPVTGYDEEHHSHDVEETEPQHNIETNQSSDEGLTAIALFDFDGEEEDEVNFVTGDKITHIETIDSGWWVGVINGRKGMFPSNYVEINE